MRSGHLLYAISLAFCLGQADLSLSQPAELKKIFSDARQQNKDVLLYVHATWCVPCRLLEKDVFPRKDISDSLRRYVFVPTSLDKSELGSLIARKYGITAVPSFLLLSPSGELLRYISGSSGEITGFIQLLAQLREPGSLPGFSTDFAVHYPSFYDRFFPSFQHVADSNEVSRYFDGQQDLENEVNFDIFMTHPVSRKYMSYFLMHARSFTTKYGPLYAQRVDRIYLSNLKHMIGEKDTVLYTLLDRAHYITDSVMGRDPERLRRFRYISFLGKSGLDWSRYINAVDEWESRYGHTSVLLFGDDVYLNCLVPSVCLKMAGYLKGALGETKQPTEDSYFKYAVLLHRGGEDQEAQTALRRALELSPTDEPKIKAQWAVQMVSLPASLEEVRVEGGVISGTVDKAGIIHIYKGVPFAAPPIGALRWEPPQPLQPWTGVKRCAAFGPSPMQSSPQPFSMWSEEFLIPKKPIGEDCLYLNVWTGAVSPAEKRPVLVWIYGGGFGSGGSAVPIYDGEAMARKGVVFVSINYRVGIFGFFAHPELTKESAHHVSGNYGLLDQIAALKWVQKNIAAFGGDPGNVTIAGQSAGSMSVNCLVASPLARGLMRRAIGESGASFTDGNAGLAKAEQEGVGTMGKLKAASIRDLRAMSAGALLKAGEGGRGPIIDGYVLPEAIADIYKEGKENRVDLLTGWNEDEGFGQAKSAVEFRKEVGEKYGADAAALLRYYPAGTDAEAAVSQLKLSRDMVFGVHNYVWANRQSGQGTKVFVYRFARKPPATGEYVKYGAFHTAEVPYAYDNLAFVNRPWEPVDHALATEMSAYWANFAAAGDPNGNGLPVWRRYTVADKQIMVLDKESVSRPLADSDGLDLLFKLLSPANAQSSRQYELKDGKVQLTLEGAAHFADLPLRCMQREFPYKTGIAFPDSTLAVKPKEYHPAFYGCFDWHSSVHGHWMLVRLLKLFPGMPRAEEIRQKLTENLSAENIAGEMKIFSMKDNLSFERTYGWAWLLQLENELLHWDDPLGRQLAANVSPLAKQLSGMFVDYLPKMNYPVRVGEHTNLAFALRLAWDYAMAVKDEPLIRVIRQTALRFYKNDVNYPFSWEPGGNDFLSPGLEEADLMWRILPDTAYQHWVRRFLPKITDGRFTMKPGKVTDRSDGKLVHLDGLNLSRAWDLYGIARHLPANRARLYALANAHLLEALPNVASGDYMGEHWLASFAVYALTMQ